MKTKSMVVLTVILLILAIPLSVPAMDKGQMEEMSKGGAAQGDMEGMVMLGTISVEGIKAMGHMMDTAGAMAPNGVKMTHHFMVMFNDEKTGAPVIDGVVALKITTPSGKTGDAIKLMPMTMGTIKGFGASISLTEKGTYKLDVGSKLPDGQKRQFNFTYTRK